MTTRKSIVFSSEGMKLLKAMTSCISRITFVSVVCSIITLSLGILFGSAATSLIKAMYLELSLLGHILQNKIGRRDDSDTKTLELGKLKLRRFTLLAFS